jgi:hypothetical protein
METALLAVAIIFVSSFVLKHLNSDPGTDRFVLFLVLGLTNYFIGIVWAAEFRLAGLLLFAGMVALPYVRGYEHLIFGLTAGLGSILAGTFMHRRWLRLTRQEKLSIASLEIQDKSR